MPKAHTALLAQLHKLTNLQAVIIIAVLGFVVFSTSLNNPFQGDDYYQIVNNVPVHSIAHIKLFYEGGTFYTGHGLVPLTGQYFRPLMTTVFSVIYSLFGAQPFYFHLVQLLLGIGSTILLYLFFRYSFKPAIALILSLIFLLHPMDSQTLLAIPSMQDALFFFFGILALWTLIRFSSIKSLLSVIACLFLSLLAKESGVLFVAMALLYLFWWDRRRLRYFIGLMVVPLVVYIFLRIHAVGVLTNPYGGPIDRLNFVTRLLTAPSIVLFYVTKFIFPWKLATGYYWTYRTFSIAHVLIPMLVDCMLLGLMIYAAFLLRKHSTRDMVYTYLFFAIWAGLGMLMLIQIVPLDMTACETWFYFPMVGVLGMAGVVVSVLSRHFCTRWLLLLAVVILVVFGVRTAIRGTDWRNPYTLSLMDIANSQDNYRADTIVANDLVKGGKYAQAIPYAQSAITTYPQYNDFISLAVMFINEHQYADAQAAYVRSLTYASPSTLYEAYDGLGALTLFTGNTQVNRSFLVNALKKFPQDSSLWLYLAILEARSGNNTNAKIAITNATRYGQIPESTYVNIMNDYPFQFIVAGETIHIP